MQFLAVGWNCYPGWLLRDLRHQPASPWDWMQFFSAASLPLLLTPAGISALVEDLQISTISPAGSAEEPHFWSPRFRVRSPHDHARQPFHSLAESRRLIRTKLERRLERLRQLAADPGLRLVLLCTSSPGAYGLAGYDPSRLAEDLAALLAAAAEQLQPAQPLTLLLSGPEPWPGAAMATGEPLPLPGVGGAFLVKSRWHCEDAYFALTPGSDTERALADWARTLKRWERWLDGPSADPAAGMGRLWSGPIRWGSAIRSRLASKRSR